MAREYTIPARSITVAGASTLVFINPSATMGFEILSCRISQNANATSAQVPVQLGAQVSAFPTLTTITPRKTKRRDPASGIVGGTAGAAGTAGINASAEGAGAKEAIVEDVFNAVNGWLWLPTERERLIFGAGGSEGFYMMFPVAPATLTGWAFTVCYGELG